MWIALTYTTPNNNMFHFTVSMWEPVETTDTCAKVWREGRNEIATMIGEETEQDF